MVFEGISRPTLVVDLAKVRANVERLAGRAGRNGVALRPHFKTHQSVLVGELCRGCGVRAATVSSASMADFFAGQGWDDITVAFPVNVRELDRLDGLAARVRLGLLVDNADTVAALGAGMRHAVDVWIKVDVGSGRCGLRLDAPDALEAVARLAERIVAAGGGAGVAGAAGAGRLRLAGLLTHDSRTYQVRGAEAVGAIYRAATERLLALRDALAGRGFPGLRVSVGDTPSASLLEDWLGVDEARPGNFAYYDLQQVGVGSCAPAAVAVAVACPVVGVYPERSEAVVYGGAVHLSKQAQPPMGDAAPGGPQELSYGAVWRWFEGRAPGGLSGGDGWWDGFIAGAWVRGLTQEHGIVRLPAAELARLRVGDLLLICPVHSCLAAHALREDTLYING